MEESFIRSNNNIRDAMCRIMSTRRGIKFIPVQRSVKSLDFPNAYTIAFSKPLMPRPPSVLFRAL